MPGLNSLYRERSLFIILITALFSIVVTIFSLQHDITAIFPHLFYIPIILAAYRYPKKGIPFSIFVGLIYFSLVYCLKPSPGIMYGALIRVIVMAGIAMIIVYFRNSVDEGENRYQQLFEESPVGLLSCDPEGNITDINTRAIELLGSPDKEATKAINLFKHLGLKEAGFSQVLEQAIREKRILEGNQCYSTNWGREEWYYYKIEPVMDREGHLTGITVVFDGESARIKGEEALRESEERLNLAVDGAGLYVWDWNIPTGNIAISGNWTGALEYLPHELETSINTWYRLVHRDDIEPAKKAVLDHFDNKTPNFVTDFRIEYKEGYWIWVHALSRVALRDEDGSPVRAIGILQDITEKKQYQNAIVESNKKLNLLSGITRHDILNQISGILGYMDLIRDTQLDDPDMPDYLEKIEKMTNTIYEQILFTRDYQDLGVKEPGWQNVKDVVLRAKSTALPEEIHVDVTTGSLEVFADPLLERAVFTMLENAARHGGEGLTDVGISFYKDKQRGTLVVADNGVGVPGEMKENIFKRGVGTNTGLGLFLIREILAITGMSIQETGEEGRGARFEIDVPPEAWRM